jgi:hypothetical protein
VIVIVLVLQLVLDLDDDEEDEYEVDRNVDDEAAFGKWAEPASRLLAALTVERGP